MDPSCNSRKPDSDQVGEHLCVTLGVSEVPDPCYRLQTRQQIGSVSISGRIGCGHTLCGKDSASTFIKTASSPKGKCNIFECIVKTSHDSDLH